MISSKLFQHKYIPATHPGAEEKLVLVFHGLGDSLNGFTWMPPQLHLDTVSYLLVNAPDDYYGGYSWFDFSNGGNIKGVATPGILRSRGLIKSLIGEVIQQGVKPLNLILFGFSQGCLMAVDAGLRADVVLGGICGVSGWLAFQEEYPDAFSASALKQKFLVTHGTHDPLLPFNLTKAQCGFLSDQGIEVTFKSFEKDHTILPEELIVIGDWLKQRLRI